MVTECFWRKWEYFVVSLLLSPCQQTSGSEISLQHQVGIPSLSCIPGAFSMSSNDTDQDDSLGVLALTALAAGGAMLLWKMLGFSNEETKPNEAPHFMQVAGAFMEQGKYNEAIQAAQKAIEANPTDPNPYNLIAWILAINNE